MSGWETYVRKVEPYVPGEQPKRKVIKLNTNENPYPPSPRVQKVLDGFDAEELRLYPDPEAADLIEAIALEKGLSKDQIFVGVGSDDVLAMSFLTFFSSDKPILFPDITYSFYDVWAELFRIPYVQIPLQKDFRICIEDYKRENGGIVIPNPNAPTGIAESLDAIEEILKTNPDSVVIIDEAYVDFGTKSALALLPKYENLLVVQTFSKSRSLAGSRIGYAMGSPKLISYLNDCKYSFNSYTMDRLTIQIGKASMEDTPYFKEQVDRIVETREWAKEQLRRLGFTFLDSKANFIFASHAKMAAAVIFAALKEKDIYVRYFNKPRIDNFLRITIGTKEEMERLFAALEEILQQA
ncbi:histidinol-phosphate transaminase [Roseburia sp. AM16-25]|uniref:histidinol-phosphate transaminase n=1 Tax=Roseburia sp. AM16-25 TaxID=2292065 RepID=UPI000E52D69A|nr:histidinol-phosphate transaminase [Roseburia sp. AM16-25]RHO31739.1 histidinol-phosphate transaminase [Roseburia sp. AM16-25]